MLRKPGIIALLTVVFGADATACESRSADIVRQLDSAMAAFVEMDQSGFDTALAAARADLSCLAEPISAPTAAQFHRMIALEAYLSGNTDDTKAAFFAALAIQPAYLLPTEIAPPGHPLQKQFDAARLEAQATTNPVELAVGYTLKIDGYTKQNDPVGRMRIAQLIAPTGKVDWTHWLGQHAALPDLGSAAPTKATETTPAIQPQAVLPTAPPTPTAKQEGKTGMWAAAGSTAFLSGLAYAVAVNARNQFDDPQTAGEALDGLYLRTNTSVIISGVFATASVGLVFDAALNRGR